MGVRSGSTVAAVIVAVATVFCCAPGGALAQKAPTTFCRGWKAVSHDLRTDRTDTRFDTLARVERIEDRNIRNFLDRCVGVLAVGIGNSGIRHRWFIVLEVREKDMPAKNELSFIDGVRIELTPIPRKPGEPELL